MTELGLPAYLEVDKVLPHVGLPETIARRHLRRIGVLTRVGRELVVDTDRLREAEPRVHERLLAAQFD